MNTDWVESLLASGDLPWALAALAAATLASEDLACIAAGLLVATGRLDFWPATTACFAGIFAGDVLLMLAGRAMGAGALARWPLKGRISEPSLERARSWLRRRGVWVILASRFMPGTRLPVYFAAGALRMPVRTFAPFFALACALWTPLLVGAASVAGAAAERVFAAWAHASVWLALAGGAIWFAATLGLRATTWRGRRLLLGRWRRLTRWEFWPRWAVYPPVAVYCVWLAIRHRGATVFTAVNPGMGAAGGLVGESKSAILKGLAGAGSRVAEWELVEPGEPRARLHQVRDFAETFGWPVVLKPDVGERGRGVVIAKTPGHALAALEAEPAALIVQRHVAGREFGVFYVRRPREKRGEILAITDKRMTAVTGDGRSTLETLILGDDRAVCMGRFFLEQFAGRLDEIPACGEEIALTELGTHCRGAVFLDGGHLETPELAAAIEATSRVFDGFNFGRYDVKSPSPEAFGRGEFTVLELNGLTSEATSVYDPRHSVWFGWRVLCRQWKLAFEIGAANRGSGGRVWSAREVAALLRTSQT